MLKKGLGLLMVLVLAVSIGASIGNAKSKAAPKVKLSFWFPGESDVSNNYFKSMGREYSAQHPNVTIEVTQLPTSAPDVEVKLNAAQLSETFPDVFSAYLYFIPLRGPKGDFEPLNKYVAQWEGKSDMYQSALNIGKYKKDILGIGFFPSPIMLAYRKDCFKEAGLDPAKPPVNWKQLEEYAVKLTKRDAQGNIIRAGLDVPSIRAGSFYQPFMWQNGALIIDVQHQIPKLNDPKVVEAAKFIKKLVDQKVNIPFDYDNKQEMPFMNGRSAMGFIAAGQYYSLLSKDPSYKEKIGLAPVLKNQEQASFCGYRLFTMSSKCKHKDEAWKFISFMMSKEQMKIRAEKIGIPVVRKSLTDFYQKLNPGVNDQILQYAEYGRGAFVVPWNALAAKSLDTAYEETMTGSKPAAQAYRDAQQRLLDEIKKFKIR